MLTSIIKESSKTKWMNLMKYDNDKANDKNKSSAAP